MGNYSRCLEQLSAATMTAADREIKPLAPSQRDEIRFSSVMSASVKPRLAGRQPSNRGGVPRVMTRLSSHNRLRGKRGSALTGPPSRQGNLMRTYLGWPIVRRNC